MKRLICLLLLATMLAPQSAAFAREGITLYVNGSPAKLDTPLQNQNGTVMLPVKELLERMGFFVQWGEYDRRGVMKQGLLAEINGADMIVPPDSAEACYDEIWFELDTPTIGAGEDVLAPLEFIQYFYGVEAVLNGNELRIADKYVNTAKNFDDMGDSELQELIASLPHGDLYTDEAFLIDSPIRANAVEKGYMTKKVLPAEDESMGFTQIVELETLKKPNNVYDAQLEMPINHSVEKGDVLVLRFWARMISTVDESGFATLGYTVEEFAKASFLDSANGSVSLSSEWKEYSILFAGREDWEAGVWRLCLKVGYNPQVIQVAGLSITNYYKAVEVADINTTKKSVDTYYGREEGALWREEAFKRIEKYRVRDITVSVTDADGNPVQDAEVSADMTRSEFMWGTIGPVAYASILGSTLRKYMLEKFNTVTPENSMKIGSYEAAGGATAVDHANFTIDNNMYLHGHVIFWDSYTRQGTELNAAMPTMSEAEIRKIFYSYASELIRYFGDSMAQLDVLNEPRANSKTRDRFGVDWIADLFRLSALLRDEYAPDLKLYLNETGISGAESHWPYVYSLNELVTDLKNEGAVIEGIGHQYHGQPIYYPQTIYNQFDYVADLVDEITITEYDSVYSGNALSKQEALELEGDFLRDSIIMAYSNPKMAGFIMWGMYDQQHWRGDSPMLDREFNEKPGVKYWDQLVLGEWKTKTGGRTDNDGICAMRGHRGEYEVTVKVGAKEAKTTLKVSDCGENRVTAVVCSDGTIALNSSETVVKKDIPRKSTAELLKNRPIYQATYLKYMENLIAGAKTETGADASVLIDGKADSYWVSAAADSNAVCELNQTYDNGRIRIDWLANSGQNLYRVEVSNDGEAWTTLKTGVGEDTDNIRVVNCPTRYIRISGLTNKSIAVSEISFSKL